MKKLSKLIISAKQSYGLFEINDASMSAMLKQCQSSVCLFLLVLFRGVGDGGAAFKKIRSPRSLEERRRGGGGKAGGATRYVHSQTLGRSSKALPPSPPPPKKRVFVTSRPKNRVNSTSTYVQGERGVPDRNLSHLRLREKEWQKRGGGNVLLWPHSGRHVTKKKYII